MLEATDGYYVMICVIAAPSFCEINNGGCQQLCLLSANSDGYSCSCADGFLPTNDDNSQCAGIVLIIINCSNVECVYHLLPFHLAASTYSVTFCLSGIGNCNSWAVSITNDRFRLCRCHGNWM